MHVSHIKTKTKQKQDRCHETMKQNCASTDADSLAKQERHELSTEVFTPGRRLGFVSNYTMFDDIMQTFASCWNKKREQNLNETNGQTELGPFFLFFSFFFFFPSDC